MPLVSTVSLMRHSKHIPSVRPNKHERHGKSKKDKKDKSKKDKKEKEKKSSGGSKGGGDAGDAGDGKRAKSAYTYFCTDRRADVLRKHGIAGGADSFGQATQFLAKLWKDTPISERQKYEGCADVDRHRVALGRLRKEAKSDGAAVKLTAAIKDALNMLSRAPALARTLGACVEAVEALETLDKRMGPNVRAAVGAALGAYTAPATAALIQRSLGKMLGDRVAAFLRRLAAQTLKAAKPVASPTKKAATKPVVSKRARADAGPKGPVILSADSKDSTRRKVAGLLLKSFAKGSGKAELGTAKGIERALYEAVAGDSREYKSRARAILFNLAASDGSLIRRVLASEITPFDLVRATADDLVSEAKQAERQEQREKVLKESLVVAQVKKRHRDGTDDGNYNHRKDQPDTEDESEASDLPEEEEETQQTQVGGKLDPLIAAARAAAAQSMLDLDDADDKGSGSSSSSGSDSESDSSDGPVLPTDVKSQPTPVRAAAKTGVNTAGAPSSKAASSTSEQEPPRRRPPPPSEVASKKFTAEQKAAAAAKLAKIAKADTQRKVDELKKAAASEESSSSSSEAEETDSDANAVG